MTEQSFIRGRGSALSLGLLVFLLLIPVSARRAKAAQALDDLLRQAESDFRTGHLDDALQKAKAALVRNPASPSAYYLIGAIQERKGAREDAKISLLQAIRLDGSLLPARILLGRILLAGEKLDEAEAQFSAALKNGDDGSRNAQYGLGLVLLEQSRSKEALPHLAAAWEAQPKDLPRLYALISAELDEGLATASEHRRLFDAVTPARPEISYKLGMLFLQHHMAHEAEIELGGVAHLIETGPPGALPQDVVATTFLSLARLHFQGHRYRQALDDLSKVPSAVSSERSDGERLVLAGRSLIAIGETSRGLEKLKEAASKDGSDAAVQVHLAWAELLANRPEEARAVVQKLQAQWPQEAEVGRMSALVAREFLGDRTKVPWSTDWHLSGAGAVCCPCKTPCPCRSNGMPTEPHCEATGAYRITHGHYGNVPLDNSVFVTMDANMGTSKAPLVLFAGPEATEAQLIALERIYQAFNPLQPVIFPTVVRTPISFVVRSAREYEINIPGRLEMRLKRQMDGSSRPLLLTAAVDPFANVLEYARNITYRAWGQTGNLLWDFSGRQANVRFIDLDASDYRQSSMLYQFLDGAGSFNEPQTELIRKLNLPLLPASAAAAR